MAVRTCVILRVWKQYMRGLEQQALGAPECCNQSSLGHSSVNAEQDRNADSKHIAQAAARNKDAAGNQVRGHSCCILAKILFTFCPCPENLSETKFNRNGLN